MDEDCEEVIYQLTRQLALQGADFLDALASHGKLRVDLTLNFHRLNHHNHLNEYMKLLVKMTLRSAASLRRALARHSLGTTFHLGHSWVTCVSFKLHLSFTCSSLIHTSFTCGSLGQRSVQWKLHNWLFRALRRAPSKANRWSLCWKPSN